MDHYQNLAFNVLEQSNELMAFYQRYAAYININVCTGCQNLQNDIFPSYILTCNASYWSRSSLNLKAECQRFCFVEFILILKKLYEKTM